MAYDNYVNVKLVYCHNTKQQNTKYIQSNWLFKITCFQSNLWQSYKLLISLAMAK